MTENITVNDRSGAPWESSVTENAEVPYTGQPSPPQRFPQLGVHTVAGSTLPQVTAQAVAGGPNKGFTFAQSLQAGSYISQPKIHPDLSDPKSAFMVFHQQPGLLFIEPGGGRRARADQPAQHHLQRDALHGRFQRTAVGNRFSKRSTTSQSPTARDANPTRWWTRTGRWTAMRADANLSITPAGDAHIRAALGLSATDALPAPTITPRGSFTIFLLLAGPAIHTGTQSHEYVHAVHSHRGNYKKMMRALDPQRKAESKLFNPGATQSYAATISDWWTQIAQWHGIA